MASTELPKAVDLSHHLSDLSRARATSPLKGLQRYWGKPGLVSLAGGLPSPDYFPISNLSADTLVKDSFRLAPPPRSIFSWLRQLFLADPSHKERTEHLTIPKYAVHPEDVSLDVALQYGMASGLLQLQKFVHDFTEKVFQPQYADFATLLHAGNTDAWSKIVQTLCNNGEMILTEEWTYPSALATAQPMGILPMPIKMDSEGMRSDDLRKVLSEWDEGARGAKRPHVMYTVPIGQNPTGSTMGAQRKKEIYDICVEYDVIIVEDDPYYFLQQGEYVPKAQRVAAQPVKVTDDEAAYIASLAPSFVRFDYQGRVVRLDSFSKTIAPGSRLGWYTCNPVFAERLERQNETSTQAPCGFGQSVITQLLTKQWGYSGFIRWLRGLRTEYTLRRDFMVDCLAETFHLQPVDGACTAFLAHPRSARGGEGSFAEEKHAFGGRPLFTFVPPTSGMFVWIKVDFDNLPPFSPKVAPQDEAEGPEMKLWIALAEAGLLVGPGSMFGTERGADPTTATSGHMRISFSNAEYADMKKAVGILDKVLREAFNIEEIL